MEDVFTRDNKDNIIVIKNESTEPVTLHGTNVMAQHAKINGSIDNENDPGDVKLLRKLDWHLIPTLTLLYLLNFLDRVNIGQAKIDGLTESLKLNSNEYSVCLSVFFITYIFFEVPSNLILKRLRPSRWIPTIMIAWGIVMTLTGLVQSYGDLIACRLLLGMFEAGLFPGANFYLSSWYRRREISWRVSILFSATGLAGAFGGILAYGITKMNGLGGQEGWRWIFYVEGMATVVVGALSFLLLYDFPSDRPRFLTETECNRVINRLQTDVGTASHGSFNWKHVYAAFTMWKLYIWSICFLSISVPFYSLSLFSPTIIKGFGFATYQAQLLTAPPYAFAFITTMSTAYFSDKYARRSIFIIFWLLFGTVGYIVLIVVDQFVIKYLAVVLVAGSLSPCVATCIAFLSGNVSPDTKRAVALAFMISIGASGGVISGQLYRNQDAPKYIVGHAINLGFCSVGLLSAIVLLFTLRAENRRRDKLCEPIVKMSSSFSDHDKTGSRGAKHFHIDFIGTEEQRRQWGYENLSEQEIRDLGDQHVAWRYIL